MIYLKPYPLTLPEPGWARLNETAEMQTGDIIVFCKPVAGGYTYKQPSLIKALSWNHPEGLKVDGWEGNKVGLCSKTPAKDERDGWCYAVMRPLANFGIVQRKRTYKPSLWAEPLPLP